MDETTENTEQSATESSPHNSPERSASNEKTLTEKAGTLASTAGSAVSDAVHRVSDGIREWLDDDKRKAFVENAKTKSAEWASIARTKGARFAATARSVGESAAKWADERLRHSSESGSSGDPEPGLSPTENPDAEHSGSPDESVFPKSETTKEDKRAKSSTEGKLTGGKQPLSRRGMAFLKDFFKKEVPLKTDESVFNGQAQNTFEWKRLFPLSVCCIFFGWIVPSYVIQPVDYFFVDSIYRWKIIPIAVLSCIGSFCGIRHFLRPKKILWIPAVVVCTFTAIVGLYALLWFQTIAEDAIQSNARLTGNWRIQLTVLVVKAIGWFYQLTDAEYSSMFERYIGYIGGVGLCEEFTKMMPLYFIVICCKKQWAKELLSLRTFLVLGFFSGLGFGIGEALTCYSLSNGNFGFNSQIIRWFALVPSHAIWTICDASFLWILSPRIERASGVTKKLLYFVLAIATMAVLHGAYDVLCSKSRIAIFFAALSLFLMWLFVRIASRRSPFDDNAKLPNMDDFNVCSVNTFGKSFLKLYLAIVIGLVSYWGFFTISKRQLLEMTNEGISSSSSSSESEWRVIVETAEQKAKHAWAGQTDKIEKWKEQAKFYAPVFNRNDPTLFDWVVLGEILPPNIYKHDFDERTGKLFRRDGEPLEIPAELWNARMDYSVNRHHPDQPPSFYDRLMTGEFNVPFPDRYLFDGKSGIVFAKNGAPNNQTVEKWNNMILYFAPTKPGEQTLYDWVMQDIVKLPRFSNHQFDAKTGCFKRNDGKPLDNEAELWNARMRYSVEHRKPNNPMSLYDKVMTKQKEIPHFKKHHFDGETGCFTRFDNEPLDARAELWNAQILYSSKTPSESESSDDWFETEFLNKGGRPDRPLLSGAFDQSE